MSKYLIHPPSHIPFVWLITDQSRSEQCHFLQIWAMPNQRGLPPKYFGRHFTDEDKKDKLVEIVAPITQEGVVEERDAKGPTPIHANLNFYASLLSPSASATHTLRAPVQASASGKLLYVQLVQTSGFNTSAASKDGSTALVKVAGESGEEAVLGEGDGVFIRGGAVGDKVTLTNQGGKVGEVVVFEMDA